MLLACDGLLDGLRSLSSSTMHRLDGEAGLELDLVQGLQVGRVGDRHEQPLPRRNNGSTRCFAMSLSFATRTVSRSRLIASRSNRGTPNSFAAATAMSRALAAPLETSWVTIFVRRSWPRSWPRAWPPRRRPRPARGAEQPPQPGSCASKRQRSVLIHGLTTSRSVPWCSSLPQPEAQAIVISLAMVAQCRPPLRERLPKRRSPSGEGLPGSIGKGELNVAVRRDVLVVGRPDTGARPGDRVRGYRPADESGRRPLSGSA